MASKMTKPVTREVSVGNGFVNVTIDTSGITLQGKGTSRKLALGYADVARLADGSGVPSKFADDRLGWLTESSAKKAEVKPSTSAEG
jgi:hypothetical protein